MKYLQVKVCGITRAQDAQLVAELGADMVGFIFYRRSPRWIAQQAVRSIIKVLPATVDRVGVFVDEELKRVIDISQRLQLDYVQLHGHESTSFVAAVQRSGTKVIQSVSICQSSDYDRILRSRAELVLIDNAGGGTGKTFDWALQPPKRLDNLVLAGGINTKNVAEGIRRFRPRVVDISSALETKAGVKSAQKLREFMSLVDKLRYRS